MPELQGFMPPRSPPGRASVVPSSPQRYSGDVLTLESETGGSVNALPMLHSRPMPAISPGTGDALDELVKGAIFTGGRVVG